jgi:hypothetical protein
MNGTGRWPGKACCDLRVNEYTPAPDRAAAVANVVLWLVAVMLALALVATFWLH